MKHKYPCPIRFHWKVMIEFNDGSVIYGASDDDLVERWGRILSMTGTRYRAWEVRGLIRRYIKSHYGVSMGGDPTTESNTEFLEALDSTHQISLIRK